MSKQMTKTAARKTTPKKKNTSAKTNSKTTTSKKKKPSPVAYEVIGVMIIGVTLLVMAGVYTDKVGMVGTVLKHTFIGVLGISGYILPIYGLYLGFCYIKRDMERLYESLKYMLPLIILLSTLFHVIAFGENQTIELMSLTYIKEATWLSGGWLGAAIGYMLLTLLGIYGTCILLFALLGIWILVITQFPVVTWVGEKIEALKENLSVKKAQAKEAKLQKKKEQKAQKALQRKAAKEMENRPEEELHIAEPFYEEEIETQVLQGSSEVAAAKEEAIPVFIAGEHIEREPIQKVEKQASSEDEGIAIREMPFEEQINYVFPSIELLKKGENVATSKNISKLSLNKAKKLEETLGSFGVEAKVLQIHRGPTVTRYELQPKQGVKVSKIVNLADDIALNLAASGIRIEAPIPGKSAVGIEVPNESSEMVYLRDVIDSDQFRAYPSKLAFALGKDIAGKPMITDIARMPHVLIAGSTGSGKSVCINTMITSILYKAKPTEVKLIMIDPKVVELNIYNGIPHLLIPVVTDPKKAAGALCWAVSEMTKRYNLFAETGVRDMKGYNKKVDDETLKMPSIVIIIDELADLMMTAAKEVEDAICRLAQMARAAGIHLVIATQRPSVDVITGVIKANIPSRLAFAVSSGVDSRTILDGNGAEKLLGKGDMLFCPIGESKPIRIQGAFISDKEVEDIVEAVKQTGHAVYEETVMQSLETPKVEEQKEGGEDELINDAINLVQDKEKVSISMLQRYFRIGFNRASRLMDSLEARGIVGPDEGSKPRKVVKKD